MTSSKLVMSDISVCHPVTPTNVSFFLDVTVIHPSHSLAVTLMQNYAIHNHLTPFISMQNHYNAIYREEEREMNPTLKVHCGIKVDHGANFNVALWCGFYPLVGSWSWASYEAVEGGECSEL
jgi:hypothetical protein